MNDEFAPHEDDSDEAAQSIVRFLDIPKILHSVEKDMPFRNCLQCGADLLTSNRYYVIEKVFKRNEVIVELAMCLECREDQGEEGMSAQSASNMQSFVEQRINVQERLRLMSQVNDSDKIDPWLERCILSDQPSQIFSEFQIVALCRGPWIQRDFYPALISGRALEEMSDSLSPETRDWMDDFVGDNFGMPSEFCEPPSFTPMIM
ncbi:MAG: hypothetical protein AAGA30_07075 [Planctomycetota bacterium]